MRMLVVRFEMVVTGDSMAVPWAKFDADISWAKVLNAEALVILSEASLKIKEWWTEQSVEYLKYYKENFKTSFCKAVDELEKAVIMRIWELTKMKATGTGACNNLGFDWI